MDKNQKQMVMGVCCVVGLLVAGYIAYVVYNKAVSDATQRIKQGVTQGVEEGVGGAMNPLKMFGR